MKILKEDANGPTVIELDPDESALFFQADGTFKALMAEPEGDYVNDGAAELSIALIALADKTIHDSLRKRFEDDAN